MHGFVTITDKNVVKFVVQTATGKNYKTKTKLKRSQSVWLGFSKVCQ